MKNTILYLEDDPTKAKAIEAVLRGAGYEVKVCATFSEAMQVSQGKASLLKVGSVRIDCAARQVEVNGKRVVLRRREFDILVVMALKSGKVIRRDELLDQVKASEDCSDRAIDCHLSRLRKKLSQAGASDVSINSVYGVGYSVTLLPSNTGTSNAKRV